MHGLALYVKEGLPFAWDLSLENSVDSYLCFRLALFPSVYYFFFLYQSPSSLLCKVFDSISSNIEEILSINPSAKKFVFGDFNIHHLIAYDYSCADWDGLCDHLRDVPREDIFKLSTYTAASEFCEWIQVGIDVYIPHHKYQVKPHSSPWFAADCAAAIVHRNHVLHLYQQNKSSESKVKFRQASNHCKRVLEAAKLAYATKTKESITSQKLGSQDSCQIANSILNKVKSAIPPLFNRPEVLSSASDKAKLFAKNFSKNSNFDDSGISLPVFPSRTNLKLHNISITPKMVKKIITNLDSSKVCGPDCIPVVVLKNCEPEISYILAELFNMCLKESCFPDCWKVSSVVPVSENVGGKVYC